MFQHTPQSNSHSQLKAKLTQKLTKIDEQSDSLQNDAKANRLESFYARVNEKIKMEKMEKDQTINSMEEETNKIQQRFKITKRNFEVLLKPKQKNFDRQCSQFDIGEKKMTTQTGILTEQIKYVKKGIIESIEKKYKTLKVDAISTLNEDFELLSKQHQGEVNEKLNELERLIQEEENNRNSTAELLINSFGEEVLKLQQGISLEKYQRIESNNKMKNTIKQMEEYMLGLFEQEQRESDLGRENLQKRLEEVCYRIQAKILGQS